MRLIHFVFLAVKEVEEWDKKFKSLMLKAVDLIAPSNLILTVESTFKWHRDAICAWEEQKEARPAGYFLEERPSIMEIVNEWR